MPPLYEIHYLPEIGLPPERVEGDRVDIEGSGTLVIRATRYVMHQPRDIVAKRLAARQVAEIVEVQPQDGGCTSPRSAADARTHSPVARSTS